MPKLIAALAMLLFTSTGLTGTWTGEMADLEGGKGGAYLQVQQVNEKITGVTGAGKDHAWPIKNAIYTDGRLTFTVTSTDPESGAHSQWVFDLKVDGDRMEGTADGTREGRSWSLAVKLTREK